MSLDRVNEKIQRESRTDKLLNSTLDELKHETNLNEHSMDDMIMSLDESWEDYKKLYEKSKEVIYPNIIPIGQTVITTATLLNILEKKKYIMGQEFDINMMETLKKTISEVQVVVAVGPSCQQAKVGDLVKLRMADFFRVANPNSVNSKETFELPLEEIDEVQYVEMHERNIKYIYKK